MNSDGYFVIVMFCLTGLFFTGLGIFAFFDQNYYQMWKALPTAAFFLTVPVGLIYEGNKISG